MNYAGFRELCAKYGIELPANDPGLRHPHEMIGDLLKAMDERMDRIEHCQKSEAGSP